MAWLDVPWHGKGGGGIAPAVFFGLAQAGRAVGPFQPDYGGEPLSSTFHQLSELGPVFAVLAIVIGGLFWLYIRERQAHAETARHILDLAQRSTEAHVKATAALDSVMRQLENLGRVK